MKKRLSDSITDSWSRRRPSLPQGATPPTILPGSSRYSKDASSNSNGSSVASKSRSRASSAATPTAGTYARSPPSLNSSPSLATIASVASSSSGSSYRGGLSRRDSYDIMRGYSQPSLASIPSRGATPGEDSPTIPRALDPVRNVSSRPIANLADIRQAEEDGSLDYQGGFWEVAENVDPTVQAAADVGMRRVGLTRKISDSRRIMTPVLDNQDEGGGSAAELEEGDDHDESTVLVATPRNRGSTQSGAQSSTYDMSSDEESTSSSVGTKSTIGSTRTGASFTNAKTRSSRGSGYPHLELQTTFTRPSTANSMAVDRQVSALMRPSSSTGYLSRTMNASPMKSGTPSGKVRLLPGLEIPGLEESGSRLSSLAGRSSSSTSSSQHTSAASSRAPSTNISSVIRSDSNSSTTSTSTSTQTARTNTPSAQRKLVSSRDRNAIPRAPAAAASTLKSKSRHPPSLEPPIPDPASAPKVDPAPASGMYWYKAPTHGLEHKPLRAHTCTLVGSNIYVFGGCDLTTCFHDMHVFDADSMSWSKPEVCGDIPPRLRAMTCTAVRNKLVIFGGGDGPIYYNDIYVFDTTTSRYTKIELGKDDVMPCPRRAHTACLYKNGIYVFGGGDGVRALNDVWRLDVTDIGKPSWRQVSPAQSTTPPSHDGSSSVAPDPVRPKARGYHTANMVGSKLIIYGGSDGEECFKDVWVFDVEKLLWSCVEIKKSFSRLSHSATVIGSYLFVVGGHDGVEYSHEVLLLNLGMFLSGRVGLDWFGLDTDRVVQ